MTTERYARHSLIDWFDQDAVRRERLVVVGAGAVGNEVIKNLALLGVGEIHIYDRDSIEIHNLTRSVLFRESDVGQPKAACAATRARELDPSVLVIPYAGDFWTTLTLRAVGAATAVFCCVDNFEARIRLNRLCAIAGTPLINVGIDSRFAVVERFPFTRVERVPCYECGLPPSAYAAISRRYSCGWLKRLAAEERKIPTTILTSSSAASLAVSVYLRSTTDHVTPGSWRYFQDTFSGQTTLTEIGRLAGCPGCGDLLDRRVIIAAGREIDLHLAGALGLANIGAIVFSDRVLTHLRCVACDTDGRRDVLFERAERYDETLVECPRCHQRSRQIGLRDQFELEELLRDFRGYRLPGKFITTWVDGDMQLVVELEGDEHVRGHGDCQDGGSHTESGSDVAS
jgi:molybdopterin/thiamine biosynthesis adenylyltransferase